MKITVLGNCGPYPRAGGACSGYLFEYEDIKILLDCGNGTLSRLFQIVKSIDELDMIFLSHLHSDHLSDIMVLRYAIALPKEVSSISLYAPANPHEIFNQIQYEDAFLMHPIEENAQFSYKGLNIRLEKMEHTIDSYGICIQNENKKFVYSGDTKYCSALLELAKDADLLLCESAVLEKDKTPSTPHLSAREAGKIGKLCNVKQLLLTHFWPEYEPQEIFSEAKKAFDGNIILSEEMKTYLV